MEYKDQLRHPFWQKKRLQVMKRDKFKCILCGDKETTLNVHHLSYEPGKLAWEYPLENFQTLCERCHKITEHVKGFKERPVKCISIDCGNYEALYVVMSGDMVLRYTYSDGSFTSGGILTHTEFINLTSKKRLKNAG